MRNVVFSKETSQNTNILYIIARKIKEEILKQKRYPEVYVFTFIEADLGDYLVQGSAQGSLRLPVHV
jgi:hypothetical protein